MIKHRAGGWFGWQVPRGYAGWSRSWVWAVFKSEN